MRWKHMIVGLALTIGGLAGCKQQCFLHECDYNHYIQDIGLPADTVCDPEAPNRVVSAPVPKPMTVNDLEREPRYLSLAEAVAIGLEQGRFGSTFLNGTAIDNLTSTPGPVNPANFSDSVRVLRLDPAKLGADIENSLAKFDAQWQTSMIWNNTDQAAPTTFLNQFQPNGESATLRTSLVKPLPTGGIAGVTFDTNYRLTQTPQTGLPNPSYTTDLQFQFEQPLLQGFGVEINQLRTSHPGLANNPFSFGIFQPYNPQGNIGAVEGILVARVRFDQDRATLENEIQTLLVNVKQAYWNLYDSYWTLYAREAALRQAFEAWKINKARYEAGRIPIQDFAQTRQQYELFRSQRLAALSGVLESERQLRDLLGMPVEDGKRLIPVDEPVLTPYEPDWNTALNETLALRPPLVVQREELKAKLFDVMLQKNSLLPDLRFFSTYGLNGIGGRLDGSDNNAFRSLASDRFTNYSLGLRLVVPIGYRQQRAALRRARLVLAQQYWLLRDFEEKAQHFLAQQYRSLFDTHAQIEINRSQRIAAAEQLEARFKEFLAGRGTLDILLEAQRVWAEALRTEYDSVRDYNNALARFEFARGTIMQDENVFIGEGPLPGCAQERAVEHERERTKAFVLRERANPVVTPPCCYQNGSLGLPQIPPNSAPSVPALLEGQPPVPNAGQRLPEPTSVGSGGDRLPQPGPAATQGNTDSHPRGAWPPAFGASPSSTKIYTSNPVVPSETTRPSSAEILGVPVAAPDPQNTTRTLPSLPASSSYLPQRP
jgi:outer membrane protein TolC